MWMRLHESVIDNVNERIIHILNPNETALRVGQWISKNREWERERERETDWQTEWERIRNCLKTPISQYVI